MQRAAIIILTASLLASIFFVAAGIRKDRAVSQDARDAASGASIDPETQALLCKDCNIILITLTNLRYDHMSQNGYARPTTPRLDEFAQESVVFDNAFSHASWTLPEAISIYTSLYPYQHGVMNRTDGSVLPSRTTTLVDVLNAAGYQAAAFTGGFDYDPAYGLTGRFSKYDNCGQKEAGHVAGYGDIACSAPKALDWLKTHADKKFFLHLQGYDTHCPFAKDGKGTRYGDAYAGTVDFDVCLTTFDKVKPEIRGGKPYYAVYAGSPNKTIAIGGDEIARMVALYDERITESDALIGSFLQEVKNLGLSDRTIIVFTSEHGDMFGKHGRFMRGGPLRGTLYDDVIHVPLIIKHPKVRPKRFTELVEHIDVAPTLLDVLGIGQRMPRLQGKSLVPLVAQSRVLREYVFAGAEYSPGIDNPLFNQQTRIEVIRSRDWKLINEEVQHPEGFSTVQELYNLANDPEEAHNLVGVEKTMFLDLQSRLSAWSVQTRSK